MPYQPHRAYIAPALPSAELYRLVFGAVSVEGIDSGMRWVFNTVLDATPWITSNAVWFGSTAAALLLQLLSFTFLAAGVVVVAWVGHGRGLVSLLGPLERVWRDLWRVFIAVMLFFALSEILPPYWENDGVQLRSPQTWILLLPLSLAALMIQIGAEELFYRSYLQQQLAARFDSPLIWMIAPNMMFALAHWEHGDFTIGAAQYVIWAFIFGLAASDLTARTGTLGAALGFHLANNTYAFLIFGESNAPDSGLALLVFPQGALTDAVAAPDTLLTGPFLTELFSVGLMWGAARLMLHLTIRG